MATEKISPPVNVILGASNLNRDQKVIFKAAIKAAVEELKSNKQLTKKKSRKFVEDDLDTIASIITAKYYTMYDRFKGPGIEWQQWHCFVGTDIVYAVRPRAFIMATIKGGPVLKDRSLSLFAFRSAISSVQDQLRKKSKPDTNALHSIDPDSDHMDRTEVIKVRTDMDDIMYNAFADTCRIALAKKHAQNRNAATSSTTRTKNTTSINTTTTTTTTTKSTETKDIKFSTSHTDFADAAIYIRSRLEMMDVFGGEWHVVAAKSNKGELQGGRACSSQIDSDAKRATIVTCDGVRIFAFQHADNAPSEDTCSNRCWDVMTSKKRAVTMFIMFGLLLVYFMLGKIDAIKCLNGGGGNGDIIVTCTAEMIDWANTIEAGRTGILVAALGFFLIGAVLKTMNASRSRSRKRL